MRKHIDIFLTGLAIMLMGAVIVLVLILTYLAATSLFGVEGGKTALLVEMIIFLTYVLGFLVRGPL